MINIWIIAVKRQRRRKVKNVSCWSKMAGAIVWCVSAFSIPTFSVTRGLASDQSLQISTAANAKEAQETSSWEEPNLFPQELPGLTAPPRANRKPRSSNETDARNPPTPIEASETNQTTQDLSSTSFRSKLGDLNFPETPAIGLESNHERDAILAKLQNEGPTQPYNIKIGRLPLLMRGGFSAEFTDNIRRTKQNKDAELILIPRLDISGFVKLGSRLSFSLGLGVGYIKHVADSGSDRFLISAPISLTPDSGISLNIKIGRFLINVYDRPTLPQFQADAVTQRQQNQYSQFTNTAGLRAFWDVNSRTNVSFEYAHANSFSFSSDRNTSDGSTDSFMASLSYKLSDSLGLGINAGAETTTYDNNFRNNGTTYHFGPSVSLELSRFLRIQASAGYQGGSYDNSGSVGDSSALGTFFASVRIANELNSHISHSLAIGRQSKQGSVSNFAVTNYVRYYIGWDLVRGVNIGANASFEDIEESGGLFAAHFRSFALGISCSTQLTKRITLSLTYAFTTRYVIDDTGPQNSLLDYDENRISLYMGYTF